METKLKIAIQKSGRLNEDSLRLIKDCGIAVDKGTNPLQVTARRDGGLSLKSFIKKITFQKISRQARMKPGPLDRNHGSSRAPLRTPTGSAYPFTTAP